MSFDESLDNGRNKILKGNIMLANAFNAFGAVRNDEFDHVTSVVTPEKTGYLLDVDTTRSIEPDVTDGQDLTARMQSSTSSKQIQMFFLLGISIII